MLDIFKSGNFAGTFVGEIGGTYGVDSVGADISSPPHPHATETNNKINAPSASFLISASSSPTMY
jgi:hypothetical protein